MNWSIDEAVRALSAAPAADGHGGAVSLPLYDEVSGVGIGVDAHGAGTLVLPGQEAQVAFETTALKFDPWCDTTWVEGGVSLPKSAVLRCRFDRDDQHLLRLVAGLLISLVDLQSRFDDAGKAIWTLRHLFGEGFHNVADRSIVLGLLGELLVIRASPDPSAAVAAWHVDADDRYDFSAHSTRLEVKTTTGSVREHSFSSRQLPPLHGLDVWVASVQLAEVALGANVASIFADLAVLLPMELSRKLSDVIIETIGLPPAAVQSPHVDIQTSIAGILIFPAAVVPTPVAVQGSSDIRWTAHLDELDGHPGLGLAPIFSVGYSAGLGAQSKAGAGSQASDPTF